MGLFLLWKFFKSYILFCEALNNDKHAKMTTISSVIPWNSKFCPYLVQCNLKDFLIDISSEWAVNVCVLLFVCFLVNMWFFLSFFLLFLWMCAVNSYCKSIASNQRLRKRSLFSIFFSQCSPYEISKFHIHIQTWFLSNPGLPGPIFGSGCLKQSII